MSTEITRENATFDSLKAVPYGNLFETFKSLGIPEIWKPGTKGAAMIQNALEKLAVIKSLKNDGKTEQEIEEKFEKQAEAQEAADRETELRDAEKKEELEKVSIKKIEKMHLSIEDIQKNIKNIDANLINGIPAQRETLLKKKVALMKILEDRDEVEVEDI